MNERIGYLIIGILAIGEGLWSLLGGDIFIIMKGYTSVSKDLSIFLIILGVLFLFISKKMKANITKEYSKCPKCKETYTYVSLEKGMCPKCDIKTIDIEKYFEQFPDERK